MQDPKISPIPINNCQKSKKIGKKPPKHLKNGLKRKGGKKEVENRQDAKISLTPINDPKKPKNEKKTGQKNVKNTLRTAKNKKETKKEARKPWDPKISQPRTQALSSTRRKNPCWGWSHDSIASGGEWLSQITNFHWITLHFNCKEWVSIPKILQKLSLAAFKRLNSLKRLKTFERLTVV